MSSSIIAYFGGDTKQFDQAAGRVEKRGFSVSRALRLGFGAIGAGISFGAIKGLVNDLDDIGKKADAIGLTTDALQELRMVGLRQAGLSAETTDMAMQRFVRRLAEARNGAGAAKQAFEEMGVSFWDASGQAKSIDDVLYQVSDALSRTAEESDRLRLAFKLFDSEGARFVNAIGAGADALKRAREEASKFTIPEETIRSAEVFNDQIARLLASMKAGGSKILGLIFRIGGAIGDLIVLMRFGITREARDIANIWYEIMEQNYELERQIKLRAEQIRKAKEQKDEEARIAAIQARQREKQMMQAELARMHNFFLAERERRERKIAALMDNARDKAQRLADIMAERENIKARQSGGMDAVIRLEESRIAKLKEEVALLYKKGMEEKDAVKRAEILNTLVDKRLELEAKINNVMRMKDDQSGQFVSFSGGSESLSAEANRPRHHRTPDLSTERALRDAVKARADQEEGMYFVRERDTLRGKGFRKFEDGKKGEFFTDAEMRAALGQKSKMGGEKGSGGGQSGTSQTPQTPEWQKSIVNIDKRLESLENALS